MLAVIILPQSDIHWQAMFDVWVRRNKRRLQRCFASPWERIALVTVLDSMQTSTPRQDIYYTRLLSHYE